MRQKRLDKLRRTLLLLPVLALTLTTAGCETLEALNPFQEREKALPGARTPVFPGGVPGVDYNQAPPQPANSAYGMGMPSAEPSTTPAPSGSAAPAQ